MKAIRWHARGDLRYEDVAAPDRRRPRYVLVEVLATGICGTDIEEWANGPLNVPPTAHPLSGRSAPLALGHEVVARVIEADENSELVSGDVVALEINESCGECPACQRGATQLCASLSSRGLHDDGGLADFMHVPELMCRKTGKTLPVLEAAFAEPLAVAVRAVRRGSATAESTALVVGGGTVGQLVSQVLTHVGAKVVLTDPSSKRRKLAIRLGAAEAVAPESAVQAATEEFAGEKASLVIESAGTTSAVRLAVDAVCRGGTIVLLGATPGKLNISAKDLIDKEITLVASLSHVMDDFEAALELLTSGAIQVIPLLTDVVPLSTAIADGFEALRRSPGEHLKVVVIPDRVWDEVALPWRQTHGMASVP